MVPRYSRPEMVEIWSQQNKFKIWFEIEAHACDAQAELGFIPAEAAKSVWQAKDLVFDVDKIDKIEKETNFKDETDCANMNKLLLDSRYDVWIWYIGISILIVRI